MKRRDLLKSFGIMAGTASCSMLPPLFSRHQDEGNIESQTSAPVSRKVQPPLKQSGRLQKIYAMDGTLYFEDGTEVALWGVNFQPSLSWEYASRTRPRGLLTPLKAKDLKRVTDESLDEIQRMGSTVIRIHLSPRDFTDMQGNLLETLWLDILDYVMVSAKFRGIYVYLTFLNQMGGGTEFCPESISFTQAFERREWMYEEAAIVATENYLRQLLNRRNPYDGIQYKDNRALGLVEPINEPSYIQYEKWLEFNKGSTHEEFVSFRYQSTKDYLNRMVALFRSEGLTQPVVWCCNWSRLIQNHEEVFRGVAASNVDAVSFCLYPGQDDVPQSYWNSPEDLSENNYLTYIQRVYDDRDYMGWLLDEQFAGKARLAYEFETFFNQSTYLYPAMAKVFRALGAQVAAQWTYSLSSYARYIGGSHVLNLQTTPRKAASFIVASEVFKAQPRFKPYTTTKADADTFGTFSLSYQKDLSAGYHNGLLTYSGDLPTDFIEMNASPERIAGFGSSDFVKYEGNGLYFLEPAEKEALRLIVYPNAIIHSPLWQPVQNQDQKVELDESTEYDFELKMPGFGTPRLVYRLEGYKWVQIETRDDGRRFKVKPGEYLIEKA